MKNNIVPNARQIVYDFYELSWIEQINILTDLCLISDDDKYSFDSKLLGSVIKSAREQNKLIELHNEILTQIKSN